MAGLGKYGLKPVQRRSNISGISPKKQDEEEVAVPKSPQDFNGEYNLCCLSCI